MPDRTPPRPGRGDRSGSSRSGGRVSGAGARSAGGTGPRLSPRTGPHRVGAGTKPGSGRPGSARPGPGKERPALAARARTKPAAPPSPSTAWVRGAILVGIVVMLAVTLVPTLRSVIQQHNQAAALRDTVAQQQQTVEELEHQAALWRDPAYIELQARQRLKFVRVGDRAYTVLNLPEQAADHATASAPIVAAPMANEQAPWYGKLWQSIQIADRPTVGVQR